VEQLGFCHTREEGMLQVMVRLPGIKLSTRFGWMTSLFAPLIIPGASLVNVGLQTRLYRRLSRKSHVKFERSQRINDEIFDYITGHAGNDFYLRTRSDWDWIESNSWLVRSSARNRRVNRRYPFSYTVLHYHSEWLLTRVEGKLTSVQLVSVRNGLMKVLYFYGTRPEDAVCALVHKLTRSWKVYAVLLSHPALLEHSEQLSSLAISTEQRSRWVGISRALREEFPEDMIIQMGDGDAVFT
jgi:hypothetical protein